MTILGIHFLAPLVLALPSQQQPCTTDVLIEGVTIDGSPAKVDPLTPAELAAVLANIASPTTRAAIQQAVNDGCLTVGAMRMGSSNYGVHDFNTIALRWDTTFSAVAGPSLEHEWEHVKEAIENGTKHDPTTQGICGIDEHANLTVDTMNSLCNLISELTGKDKTEACADWNNLKSIANAQIVEATDIMFFGYCPPPSNGIPALPSSCPACG